MRYVFGVLLLLTSPGVWSCSCFGMAPIEVAIARYPILVEGRVVSLDRQDSEEFGKLTRSATLRVAKVFKGSVGSDEITVVHSMCAASLEPNNMELNHIYVVPLEEPAPEPEKSADGYATAVIGPEPGQYEMAGCAYSGLERVGGELFAFNYDGQFQRRMDPYMSYTAFRLWWPVAQAGAVTIYSAVNLHRTFGASFLLFSLVLGTAIAYFAGRYRPWILIVAVFLASTICAVNYNELLISRVFISDHGFAYQAFSWITPAIILAGGVLGYRMRRRARTGSS